MHLLYVCNNETFECVNKIQHAGNYSSWQKSVDNVNKLGARNEEECFGLGPRNLLREKKKKKDLIICLLMLFRYTNAQNVKCANVFSFCFSLRGCFM